jgi:hypothetical protein
MLQQSKSSTSYANCVKMAGVYFKYPATIFLVMPWQEASGDYPLHFRGPCRRKLLAITGLSQTYRKIRDEVSWVSIENQKRGDFIPRRRGGGPVNLHPLRLEILDLYNWDRLVD